MKRISIGVWSIEKPKQGFGFHLFKSVEIAVKKKGKLTGEKRLSDKLVGYNIPLNTIIMKITSDEAFDNSDTFIDLMNQINNKIEIVKLSALELIIHNLNK